MNFDGVFDQYLVEFLPETKRRERKISTSKCGVISTSLNASNFKRTR